MNYIYGNFKVFKMVKTISIAEMADAQLEYLGKYALFDEAEGTQPIHLGKLTIENLVLENNPYRDVAILELTNAHILNRYMNKVELDRFLYT